MINAEKVTAMDNTLQEFIAGFELAGRRAADGKIYPFGLATEPIDMWPETVRVFNHSYTLEQVVKGNDGYESAVYA